MAKSSASGWATDMAITLTERDKAMLRILLKEQAKVAYRKAAWRRRRDSAKHYWPDETQRTGPTP